MISDYFDLKPHKVVFHPAVRRFARRNIAPGARVLDIASNDFRMHRLLPPVDYWAADLDLSRLDAGLRRFPEIGATAVACDIRQLPFADDSFDAVICTHTLVHLRRIPAKRRAMAELLRVLRPGGCLIFNLPAGGKHGAAARALEDAIAGRFGSVRRIVQERSLARRWAVNVTIPLRRRRTPLLTAPAVAVSPLIAAADRFGPPRVLLYLCSGLTEAETEVDEPPAAGAAG